MSGMGVLHRRSRIWTSVSGGRAVRDVCYPARQSRVQRRGHLLHCVRRVERHVPRAPRRFRHVIRRHAVGRDHDGAAPAVWRVRSSVVRGRACSRTSTAHRRASARTPSHQRPSAAPPPPLPVVPRLERDVQQRLQPDRRRRRRGLLAGRVAIGRGGAGCRHCSTRCGRAARVGRRRVRRADVRGRRLDVGLLHDVVRGARPAAPRWLPCAPRRVHAAHCGCLAHCPLPQVWVARRGAVRADRHQVRGAVRADCRTGRVRRGRLSCDLRCLPVCTSASAYTLPASHWLRSLLPLPRRYAVVGNSDRCTNACSEAHPPANGDSGVDGMVTTIARACTRRRRSRPRNLSSGSVVERRVATLRLLAPHPLHPLLLRPQTK